MGGWGCGEGEFREFREFRDFYVGGVQGEGLAGIGKVGWGEEGTSLTAYQLRSRGYRG